MTFLTLKQIAALPDPPCPYPSADRLVRQWELHPSIRDCPTGRNVERLYSERDALAFVLAYKLHGAGATLEAVKAAIRYALKGQVEKRMALGQTVLVAAGDELLVATPGEVIRTDQAGPVIALNLLTTYAKFTAAVKTLRTPRQAPTAETLQAN